MHLPFPPGEAWKVIQGYDRKFGSHRGYAAFCFDFKVAGHKQDAPYPEGSRSAPMYASATGRVVEAIEHSNDSTLSNQILIEQDVRSMHLTYTLSKMGYY